MAVSKKVIPVWVNAADKAVTFTRIDGQAWDSPLFVTVPNGVREAIVQKLAKVDGKATRNITWDLPVSMVQRSVIKSGANAGKPVASVRIAEEFLGEWLGQLNITSRGAVKAEVRSTLDAWLAAEEADDNVDLSTLESF